MRNACKKQAVIKATKEKAKFHGLLARM